MPDKRVAVVTGANRGIGREIVRQLAQRKDLHVVRRNTAALITVKLITATHHRAAHHIIQRKED